MKIFLFKILSFLLLVGTVNAKTLADHAHTQKSVSKDPFENVQVISLEMLEEALHPALQEQISEDFKYEIGRHPFPLEVLAEEPVQLEIQDLKINDQKTRFTVKILFKGFETPPFSLSGTIISLTQVPTLNRAINPQESIQESDITWIGIPTRQINRSLITTAEQLIGAEPRHGTLKPETPLRINDIKRAKAVKRGDLVTVSLRSATLNLEMQAKALEEGEIGNVIKLTNPQSNKVIQGKIVAPNTVEVFYTPLPSFQETAP